MKIYLSDMTYRYDVEQTAIMLMSDRMPRVTDEPLERCDITVDYGVSRVSRTAKGVTAVFSLTLDGKTVTETCRETFGVNPEEDNAEAMVKHAVRRSVYKAYATLTGKKPEWGALAGVKPAKLVAKFFASGETPEEALTRLKRNYYVRDDKARLAVEAAVCAADLKRNMAEGDISLYAGIPFCPTRCAYCSFISKTAPSSDAAVVQRYLSCLKQELEVSAKAVAGTRLRSVYIGGGTPTFLSAEELGALMSTIQNAFRPEKGMEFTVEAGRPDTITAEKIRAIMAYGGTRVSINPQTFSNRVLAMAGRSHTVESVYKAYDLVRSMGDLEINMDLIAGLPGDSAAGFANSVNSAISLAPENITIHTLALKKGSDFSEQNQAQTKPEQIGVMLEATGKMLREAGYTPYYLYRQKYTGGSFENVGWARDGKICAYNVYMMEELMPVLACGAGAITKRASEGENGNIRLCNPKFPEDYCNDIQQILDKKSVLNRNNIGVQPDEESEHEGE